MDGFLFFSFTGIKIYLSLNQIIEVVRFAQN